jgi:hypothetical protein
VTAVGADFCQASFYAKSADQIRSDHFLYAKMAAPDSNVSIVLFHFI